MSSVTRSELESRIAYQDKVILELLTTMKKVAVSLDSLDYDEYYKSDEAADELWAIVNKYGMRLENV